MRVDFIAYLSEEAYFFVSSYLLLYTLSVHTMHIVCHILKVAQSKHILYTVNAIV
jgi:hypothetical protein